LKKTIIKYFATISLCFVLLLHPVSDLMTLLSHVVNKEYIATVLCIKREQPENTCQGRCQLTEQFKETETKKENKGLISDKNDLSLFLPVTVYILDSPSSSDTYYTISNVFTPTPLLTLIFHPPRPISAV
jgi:hypothetical protein